MTQNKSNKLINMLSKNCQPFLYELKKCPPGSFLRRGIHKKIEHFEIFDHSEKLKSRKPKDNDIAIHNAVNEFFYKEFGWKIRNGIFCDGINTIEFTYPPNSFNYGTYYFLFPYGPYEIVYSPEIKDLWTEFTGPIQEILAKIPMLKYETGTLKEAIRSGKNLRKGSNELMIKAKKYYLIEMNKYEKTLIKMIWPEYSN